MAFVIPTSNSGGGGGVSSVNGQTGAVVLDAADVGANKALNGQIDMLPSGVTPLTGSDEFATSVLNAAWTVTHGTEGTVDPLAPSAGTYSVTERVGAAARIGGLLAAGTGGLGDPTAPTFGRSIGAALADGDSITFGIVLPPNTGATFPFVGVTSANDASGSGYGFFIVQNSGTVQYGTYSAGSFSGSATLTLPSPLGGMITFWMRRTGATVYFAVLLGNGEWTVLGSVAASSVTGTFATLSSGGNAGAVCVTRYTWVRHTHTAADGSWPWDRS
jgi:hypothetical protein